MHLEFLMYIYAFACTHRDRQTGMCVWLCACVIEYSHRETDGRTDGRGQRRRHILTECSPRCQVNMLFVINRELTVYSHYQSVSLQLVSMITQVPFLPLSLDASELSHVTSSVPCPLSTSFPERDGGKNQLPDWKKIAGYPLRNHRQNKTCQSCTAFAEINKCYLVARHAFTQLTPRSFLEYPRSKLRNTYWL